MGLSAQTSSGLTPEQREARYQGIGGSDAAAAVGMSHWKSPVQLWLEKTRRVEPENLDDKEAVYWGNRLEAIVAEEFTVRTGRKVQRWKEPYVNPDHPFIRANVDRLIVNEDALLQCKTAGAWVRWEDDEPPDEYRIQCHHEMIAARKRLNILAALKGGQKFDYWPIEWNDELAEALIRKEAEFWQYVVDDVPPPPTTAADVIALFPQDTGNTVIATPELQEVHAELLAVKAEFKDTEARKKALEDQIKIFLGADTTVLLSDGGQVIATWKASKSSQKTNWEAVATELACKVDDDTYTQALIAHTRTVPGPRVFLPKRLKEAS